MIGFIDKLRLEIKIKVNKRICYQQLKRMDTQSIQSIEEQLPRPKFESAYSKSQYLKNLKSQCLYRQNAIKTAEILIDQYVQENQELKLEVGRLHKKIQHYEEKIQMLEHQIDSQDLSNLKNCQKQLFKSSCKLSQVLQKYSILQQKYYILQKQFLKLQGKNHEKQKNQIKEQQKKQKEIKIEIQKQFNNFLNTPTNKNISRVVNQNDSTQKKSYSKHQTQKILLNENHQSSEDQITVQSIQIPTKAQKQFTESIYNQNENSKQKFPYHPNPFKKIAQNQICIVSSIQKDHNKKVQAPNQQNQQKLINKLKVLEWKIKQKDQEILLMLRRNKQIEGKYTLLKEIMEKQKDHHFTFSQKDKEETINVRMQKQNEGSSKKKVASQNTKKSNRKFQSQTDQQNLKQPPKAQDKHISQIRTTFDDSCDKKTWKNLHTYKLN